MTAGNLIKIELSPLFPVTTSGSAYTITVTGRDVNGNLNNTGGFNVSSSNTSVSINTTSGTSFTFNALLAGNTTLTFQAYGNFSATNNTNSSVLVGAITNLRLSPLFPATASGNTYVITVTGVDINGNTNNTGGYNVSISNSTVSTLASNTSTAFTFNSLVIGNTSLTFLSLANVSASNNTNASVTAGQPVRAEITPLFPVNTSGGLFTFTITGRDINGNTNNTGGFIFSVGNSSILILSTNTSTSAIYNASAAGNSSFSITSVANSSVTNSTNASVIAGTVTKILLTPQAPALTVGASQQFTAVALDVNGNTNTTVTITWAIVNLTANASINSSGFLTNNSNAGIITVNASYVTIVNVTNATYSAAATPTPTPVSSGGGGTGGNPGAGSTPTPTPTATPTPSAEPLPTAPKTIIVDEHTAVTGTFTPTSGKIEIVFNGGKNGFIGELEQKMPFDYADYVAGKIKISPKPKSVKKGSIIAIWDINLKANQDFKATFDVSKPIAPSLLSQIAAPKTTLAKPSLKPTTTPSPTPTSAPTYVPIAPKAGGNDYTGYILLFIVLLLVAGYLWNANQEQKRHKL